MEKNPSKNSLFALSKFHKNLLLINFYSKIGEEIKDINNNNNDQQQTANSLKKTTSQIINNKRLFKTFTNKIIK